MTYVAGAKRWAAALAATVGLLATIAPSIWARPATELLPDLVQQAPADIAIDTYEKPGRAVYDLVFTTAIANLGAGPLVIVGHRSSTARREMPADQDVRLVTGGTMRYAHMGALRFDFADDHDHWHLVGFDRYALLRASDGRLVRPDRKAGFCLGDRYRAARRLQAEPPRPRWVTDCAAGRPSALSVREGISVGYGDVYPRRIEGQLIDVTGLRSGRYVLVNQVNARHAIRESDPRNDMAWAVLDLRLPARPGASGAVRVLRACAPPTRCALARAVGRGV